MPRIRFKVSGMHTGIIIRIRLYGSHFRFFVREQIPAFGIQIAAEMIFRNSSVAHRFNNIGIADIRPVLRMCIKTVGSTYCIYNESPLTSGISLIHHDLEILRIAQYESGT